MTGPGQNSGPRMAIFPQDWSVCAEYITVNLNSRSYNNIHMMVTDDVPGALRELAACIRVCLFHDKLPGK